MPNVFSQPRDSRFSLKREECMHYVHQVHQLTNDYTQVLALMNSTDEELPKSFLEASTYVTLFFKNHARATLNNMHELIGTEVSQVGNTLLLATPPVTDRPSATYEQVAAITEQVISKFRVTAAINALVYQFLSNYQDCAILFVKHGITDSDLPRGANHALVLAGQLSLPLSFANKHLYPLVTATSSFFKLAQTLADNIDNLV